MAIGHMQSRESVLRAIRECDALGRDAFLGKYGFGERTGYALVYEGRRYDPKAILGVAHGYEFPEEGPLLHTEFSGGEQTNSKLRSLGFDVVPEAATAGRRNPPWATDELILALDLYLRHRQLDDTDAEVIELSDVLNRLPIHTTRPDLERFRNPNSVALKLANFAALDPAYPGTGMARGGRRDAEVWDRYHGHPDELARIAAALRAGVTMQHGFPLEPEEDEDEVEEGRLLYRQHRARERDRALVAKKKAATGVLACEVCGFDFQVVYGELGRGFIECHHLVPLSEGGRKTGLRDLALMCSNCHRMAHRRRPWPTVAELRKLVAP